MLTPFNITVIRFTQDGMPVKSMLVPLVVATAVPNRSVEPAVVCVVASSNVMPEDVMEVGIG